MELKQRVAIALVAGSYGLLGRRGHEYLAPRALEAAGVIIEAVGEELAEDAAKLLAPSAQAIIAGGFEINETTVGRYLDAGVVQFLEIISADDEGKDASTHSEPVKVAKSRAKPKAKAKPMPVVEESTAEKSEKSEKVEAYRPKTNQVEGMPEVGVSNMGLPDALVDKLFDAGIGTSVQLYGYHIDNGLQRLFEGEELEMVAGRLAAVSGGKEVTL